jgi:anaerobic selenocysteine-containing dehydrogenase
MIRTTCKVCACEPYCGIEADVVDGRMVAVRSDKRHATSKWYLCVKGHHLIEYQNDPDRMLRPMRRTEGGWVREAWDDATSDIGRRLRAIADEHGSDSVATYSGNAADSVNIVLALTIAGAIGSRKTFNALSLEFTYRGASSARVYGDGSLATETLVVSLNGSEPAPTTTTTVASDQVVPAFTG